MSDANPAVPDAGAPRGNRRRKRLTALVAIGVVAGMVGLSFAAVPLYRLFCQITGYGGTTQRADALSDRVLDRTVLVQFDSNTAGSLPWRFGPEQRSVTVRLGEPIEVAYRAENLADRAVAGQAVFNVVPDEVGAYFVKVDCFCFTRQELEAGESAVLPVLFYVDPALADDPVLDYIDTITLSYTFYPAEAGVADQVASVAGAGPADEP